MLNLRSHWPTVVMRGSLRNFENRAGHFVHRGQFLFALFGVGDHGAEFIIVNGRPFRPAALLAEEDRAGRSQFDRHRADQDGRKGNEQAQAAKNIERLLHELAPGLPDRNETPAPGRP